MPALGALQKRTLGAAEQMLADDVYDNERIGHHGATWLLGGVSLGQSEKISILTHCNTGYVRILSCSKQIGSYFLVYNSPHHHPH